ncbi:hypothetical protein K438DRAFT_1861708 [Mycena galopus ATCC 62051]|nr:hypothetical protein K438DRAFT_1861708 [Mycena galopus ATCC 62051]
MGQMDAIINKITNSSDFSTGKCSCWRASRFSCALRVLSVSSSPGYTTKGMCDLRASPVSSSSPGYTTKGTWALRALRVSSSSPGYTTKGTRALRALPVSSSSPGYTTKGMCALPVLPVPSDSSAYLTYGLRCVTIRVSRFRPTAYAEAINGTSSSNINKEKYTFILRVRRMYLG